MKSSDFWVCLQTQSCRGIFSRWSNLLSLWWLYGIKAAQTVALWRSQGKNQKSLKKTTELWCAFLLLSLFSKKQFLSVPLYCVSVDSALSNSMGLASILTFLYLFCRSVQSQALKDHLDWDHTTENRWTKVLRREKRHWISSRTAEDTCTTQPMHFLPLQPVASAAFI